MPASSDSAEPRANRAARFYTPLIPPQPPPTEAWAGWNNRAPSARMRSSVNFPGSRSHQLADRAGLGCASVAP